MLGPESDKHNNLMHIRQKEEVLKGVVNLKWQRQKLELLKK